MQETVDVAGTKKKKGNENVIRLQSAFAVYVSKASKVKNITTTSLEQNSNEAAAKLFM